MTMAKEPAAARTSDTGLSLYHLLDPEVLANPYPLYQRLRTEDPVHWDSFLHAWVVTRYRDVIRVLREFSANRTPTPEQLNAMDLSALNPIARVMVRQMLFLDPPDHTRLRALASAAFTPRRVERLRSHIQEVVDGLLETIVSAGRMDVIADLASPMPPTSCKPSARHRCCAICPIRSWIGWRRSARSSTWQKMPKSAARGELRTN